MKKPKQPTAKFEVSWYQFIPGVDKFIPHRREFPNINSARKCYRQIRRCEHVSYLAIDSWEVA